MQVKETFNFVDVLMQRSQKRREVLIINLFSVQRISTSKEIAPLMFVTLPEWLSPENLLALLAHAVVIVLLPEVSFKRRESALVRSAGLIKMRVAMLEKSTWKA